MTDVEERLEKIERELERYEQKLEGLQKVVGKYRRGEVTYEGLTYASNETARKEADIMMEVERLDPDEYFLNSKYMSRKAVDGLEELFREQVEGIEGDLAELEDRRRNILQGRDLDI